VLNFGFVEKLFVVDVLAQRRIEDLLLDLGVNGQRGANVLRELFLLRFLFELSYCLNQVFTSRWSSLRSLMASAVLEALVDVFAPVWDFDLFVLPLVLAVGILVLLLRGC
jgi:hypothetical protein